MDNSKLEKLMKQEITPEMQNELFDMLRQSELLLPVEFSQETADEEGHVGFNINYLSDDEGTMILPLFTSPEVMKSVGLESSLLEISLDDLAGMLMQTDKYSVVSINPFTDYDVNMSMDDFLDLFNHVL